MSLEARKEIDCGGRAAVARQAHNLEVAGSNPAPATNFLSINLTIDHRDKNYVVDYVITDSADRVIDQGQAQDFARYEAIDKAIMMAEARVVKLLVVKDG